MKQLITLGALALPLMASAATNLLSNGSFESGFTDWTVNSSVGTTFAPTVIAYGTTADTFGEAIPADDAASLSPDAVGGFAAYFVDDFSTQSLTQTFNVVTGGLYNVGFSLYVPLNGSQNPGNANFEASFSIATTGVLSVSTLPVQAWDHYTNNASLFLTPGSYSASFAFTTTGGQSIDVVVDRAYVVAVPEPETYALMLAGLCAVGFMARRRQA